MPAETPPRSAIDLVERLRVAPAPDSRTLSEAKARNDSLTKPPGALGRLEDLAIWYAGWRAVVRPAMVRPQILIFAGNHGITARGVSAFPAAVTEQMVANFEAGGAAINQLAGLAGAKMEVHALDLDRPTADFTAGPALGPSEFVDALARGWSAVDPDADCVVTGEMGIGNTTAAAAVAHALFGAAPGDWVGRGTGVDDDGLRLKASVVAQGLAANPGAASDPLEALRCLGGRELAAMAGAIARARVLSIPVILDGFICTAAAACLARAVPGALDHAVAGHVSEEAGHAGLLERLGLVPLLSLGLRLGEGSGAALALQILKGALACHSGMASFAEAGVSEA